MICCNPDPTRVAGGRSRRAFIQTLALGGGAFLLSTLPLRVRAAGHVDVVLLSCMDYRLMDEIASYMDGRGLKDGYDHLILAGASLGALTGQRPDWGHTFWQHLDVAIDLHHVKRVMVIDHRDCGAYKIFLGEKAVDTPAKELAAHTHYLRRLRERIGQKHAGLDVELGLMSLDGKVEPIT